MPIIKEIKDIRDEQREMVQELDQVDDEITDPKEHQKIITSLEKQMKEAAKNLEFELAAVLRDKIEKLTKSD